MRVNKNLIALLLGLLLSTVGAFAQSTNPSSPTPLTGEYSGKGPAGETSFYFKLTGGPGEISVRLDIKAKDYSTFARIEIGNDPSNLIAMGNMNASTTTGPASVVKTFKLDSQQTARIKLTLDRNLAEYKLSVNGALGGKGEGDTNSSKTGKIGKPTTATSPKSASVGSSNMKPVTKKQGSGTMISVKGKDITITCPNEIYYQIVPVAEWDATLYGKKLFNFESASVSGPMISCSYQVNGSGNDTATLIRNAPSGYTCKVYNSGPHPKIFSCTAGTAADKRKPAIVEPPFRQASSR